MQGSLRVTIGILAIQGDFAAHQRVLRRLGVDSIEVRHASDVESVDGLIIPGGESTTMLKFVEEENLIEPIKRLALAGKPIFGTCAGAILLAREVYNPAQASLGLIDIAVERNAYGRQVDSFIAGLDLGYARFQRATHDATLEAVFIRAPRIRRVGTRVDVLASLNGEPVLVRQGGVLAATFHPELTEDASVHRLFVEMDRAGTLTNSAQGSLLISEAAEL